MRRLFRSLLILGVFLAVAGCGKSKGSLRGKVTLNGEALSFGQVSAYNDKNEMIGQSTIVEGEYDLGDLPLGSVILTVQTHQPGGVPVGVKVADTSDGRSPSKGTVMAALKMLPTATQKAIEKLKPVPLKYTTTKESDLKGTVASGTTTHDIEMTGKGEFPKPLPKRPGQPGAPHGPPPIVPPRP